MTVPSQPRIDAQWQAESDAQTLAEASTIKSDRKRLKGAKKVAGKMARDKQVQANTLKRVSKTPVKSAGRPARRKGK
jgi:hypothetical protein